MGGGGGGGPCSRPVPPARQQHLPAVEEHTVDLHQQRQHSKSHEEAGADSQAAIGNGLVGGMRGDRM